MGISVPVEYAIIALLVLIIIHLYIERNRLKEENTYLKDLCKAKKRKRRSKVKLTEDFESGGASIQIKERRDMIDETATDDSEEERSEGDDSPSTLGSREDESASEARHRVVMKDANMTGNNVVYAAGKVKQDYIVSK